MGPFDYTNSGNYPNYGYGQPVSSLPPMTNMTFVTSIEEALFKATQRNSDCVFFDQDKPIFYRVKVDADGKKSWMQFEYTAPNPSKTTPATVADLQQLVARIEILEKQLRQEVSDNA